jgi:hypothetical protein
LLNASERTLVATANRGLERRGRSFAGDADRQLSRERESFARLSRSRAHTRSSLHTHDDLVF